MYQTKQKQNKPTKVCALLSHRMNIFLFRVFEICARHGRFQWLFAHTFSLYTNFQYHRVFIKLNYFIERVCVSRAYFHKASRPNDLGEKKIQPSLSFESIHDSRSRHVQNTLFICHAWARELFKTTYWNYFHDDFFWANSDFSFSKL